MDYSLNIVLELNKTRSNDFIGVLSAWVYFWAASGDDVELSVDCSASADEVLCSSIFGKHASKSVASEV